MGKSRVGRGCALKQQKVRKAGVVSCMLQLVGGGAQSSRVGSSTTSRYLFLYETRPLTINLCFYEKEFEWLKVYTFVY